MKKILLLMMCCPLMLAAQNGNGVTVSNLNITGGTVTFNVRWKKTDMPAVWSDTVWVFVDYNKAGKMERLLLSGATLSAPSWSAASVIFGKDDNKQGAWVVGNARTGSSFSATVKLFAATDDLHGACAYASNYPPVGEYQTPTQIKFTGTPPYDLVVVSTGSGTRTYSINDSYYILYEGETLQSFSDKTGAPGTKINKCHAPGVIGVTFADFNPCVGADYGSTYTLIDDRDQKTYKVKYLPDGRYWMLQDLSFGELCEANSSHSASSVTGLITAHGTYRGACAYVASKPTGYFYNVYAALNGLSRASCDCPSLSSCPDTPTFCRGVCPYGWHLPSAAEWATLMPLVTSYTDCWSDSSITDALSPSYAGCLSGCSCSSHYRSDDGGCIVLNASASHWDASAVAHQSYRVRCLMNY
jgi:uncharacterized protein (TIGR02145 family)